MASILVTTVEAVQSTDLHLCDGARFHAQASHIAFCRQA